MRIMQIENPETKAEGYCNGLPYNTDTYNSKGCTIHFWIPEGTQDVKIRLKRALHIAMNTRDIAKATVSVGMPTGFWANQNIEEEE